MWVWAWGHNFGGQGRSKDFSIPPLPILIGVSFCPAQVEADECSSELRQKQKERAAGPNQEPLVSMQNDRLGVLYISNFWPVLTLVHRPGNLDFSSQLAGVQREEVC